jgi:hypothetical protein
MNRASIIRRYSSQFHFDQPAAILASSQWASRPLHKFIAKHFTTAMDIVLQKLRAM